MTESDEHTNVYLVELDGTVFVAATSEVAKRHAEQDADDYFGNSVEWEQASDGTESWTGKYYDGPHRTGRITITGMEVMR